MTKDERPQVAIRFSNEEAGALRDAAHGAPTLTAAVRRVLADGLRWTMAHGTNRPLSTWFLVQLDDAQVFDIYRKFCEATCREVGLGGGYRFEPVPHRNSDDPETPYWVCADDEELDPSARFVLKRPLPADADTFWRKNHRTFKADGTNVIAEKPAAVRQRLYEAWKEGRDHAGGD